MFEQPLVAIIILTWNNSKDIEACLNSIKKLTYPFFKTIVVDNASQDNTKDIVKTKFPDVDLLELDKNYFFTGGNNRGIDYAIQKYSPVYLMILNPDTEVESNLLTKMIEIIESDTKIGAIGPLIKFKGGENDRKINSASMFYDGFRNAYDSAFGEEDSGQYKFTKQVFAVTGTCILFRVEMIKQIGKFWELLKMYTDEIELFIRAKKAGWKVMFTGKTFVWHKYMQSTIQSNSIDFEKLKMRNWLLIALRHYSLRAKLAMLKDYLKFRLRKKVIHI